MNQENKKTYARIVIIASFILTVIIAMSVFAPLLTIQLAENEYIRPSYRNGAFTASFEIEKAELGLPQILSAIQYFEDAAFIYNYQSVDDSKDIAEREMIVAIAEGNTDEVNELQRKLLSYEESKETQISDYFSTHDAADFEKLLEKKDFQNFVGIYYSIMSMFSLQNTLPADPGSQNMYAGWTGIVAFGTCFAVAFWVFGFLILALFGIVKSIKTFIRGMKDPLGVIEDKLSVSKFTLTMYVPLTSLLCLASVLGVWFELGGAVYMAVFASVALAFISGAYQLLCNSDHIKKNIIKVSMSAVGVIASTVLIFVFPRICLPLDRAYHVRNSDDVVLCAIMLVGVWGTSYFLSKLFKSLTCRLAQGEQDIYKDGCTPAGSHVGKSIVILIAMVAPMIICGIDFDVLNVGNIAVNQAATVAISIIMAVILAGIEIAYFVRNVGEEISAPAKTESEDSEKDTSENAD